MVDLPPPVEELNEYGKFAFLNEMYAMATQISNSITDSTINSYIQFALEAIEIEKTNMRNLFSFAYQRPSVENVADLILRCSELYLQDGQWFNISNAELQLVDKGNEPFFDRIRNCFKNLGLTNKYIMEKPIIELTFARFKMMNYFEDMQKASYKGADQIEHDPISTFEIPRKELPTDAILYNESQFSKDFRSPDNFILTDDEYLNKREEFAWAAFKSFQVVGSIFTIIWYSVFIGLSIKSMKSDFEEKAMFTSGLVAGYGILMLSCEVLSLRIFFCRCLRPKVHICCIYPGIAMYFIQYFASWIAGIIMMLSLFLYHRSSSNVVCIMIMQHMLSIIIPIFFCPCIFKWHKRVDRKFKWVRLSFFQSCWWIFVQVIFCLLFTPGINGIQFIISTALKNSPRISRKRNMH